MTKITGDKDLIEQAIEVLTDKCGGRCNAEYNPCHALEVADALRAALAEPAVEPVVCTDKQAMEVRNSIGLMKDEDERNNYGNHATAIKVLEAFLASPPPPAEVPLLTDSEIDVALHAALPTLSFASEAAFIEGVRVGEELARQKAGLK